MSETAAPAEQYDAEFFIDTVCPWCWITSRWVTNVQAERDLKVRWRFISLKFLNEDRSDSYSEAHRAGHLMALRILRVCHAVREAEGNDALGRLYTAIGTAIHTNGGGRDESFVLEDAIRTSLKEADLDESYVAHLDDESHDAPLREETELALVPHRPRRRHARSSRSIPTPTRPRASSVRSSRRRRRALTPSRCGMPWPRSPARASPRSSARCAATSRSTERREHHEQSRASECQRAIDRPACVAGERSEGGTYVHPPRPGLWPQVPAQRALNEILREVIADELVRIDDERLAFVTITSIDVDNEMNRANVFFDSLAGEEGDEGIIEVLNQHRRRLQASINRQMHAKKTPILEFRADVVIRSAERIDDILRADRERAAE